MSSAHLKCCADPKVLDWIWHLYDRVLPVQVLVVAQFLFMTFAVAGDGRVMKRLYVETISVRVQVNVTILDVLVRPFLRRCPIKKNYIQEVSKFPRAHNQFIKGSIFVSHLWCPIKKKRT